MHTEKTQPGKFEACESRLTAEILYDIIGNGGDSESLGDVESFGYYSFIQGKRYSFITNEDNQGFFEYVSGEHSEMETRWSRINDAYEQHMSEMDEEEEG